MEGWSGNRNINVTFGKTGAKSSFFGWSISVWRERGFETLKNVAGTLILKDPL